MAILHGIVKSPNQNNVRVINGKSIDDHDDDDDLDDDNSRISSNIFIPLHPHALARNKDLSKIAASY